MEIFAFTQNSVGYEDPGAEPQLRSFDEINLEIPKSAIAGVIGTAAAVAVIGAAPDAHALVQPGARCAEVGTIQQALNSNGFAAGPVDNVYGPSTTSAVRNFQVQNGLLVDGVVGPNTATAMGLPASISCGLGTGQEATAVVTASALAARPSPGLGGGAIYISRGTSVTFDIRTTAADGYNWVRITQGPYAGRYVARNFLGSGGTGANPSGVINTPTNVGVNIRSTAGGRIVGSLGEGAPVTFRLGSDTTVGGTTWVQLTSGNWVAKRYIS